MNDLLTCYINLHLSPGESVPVLKTPLPDGEGKYNSETERRHTLFCGTQLIQAKGGGPEGAGAVAVVTSTGEQKHLEVTRMKPESVLSLK